MPYLFHGNKRFILVDHLSKNGLFCQFFSSHISKPIPVTGASINAYCSYMDASDQLYVATLSDSYQLNLHLLEGSHFSKPKTIAHSTTNYCLSHPLLYCLNNHMYVTYLSHQNDTPTYNFVQESIDSPHLTTLYSLNLPPTNIKPVIPSSEVTYIFFITHDTHYHLYALEISLQQTTLIKYLTSPLPIIDYSVCYHDGIMHITYVSEIHGKYQLCYFNNTLQQITAITTLLSPCHPVIFYYYHALWINLLQEQQLKILLSVDQGESFSMSVPSSLQANLRQCYFFTKEQNAICAQEIYASISSSLKLCTIAMIDIYRLHGENHLPCEIELLLEGLSLKEVSPVLGSTPISHEASPSPPKQPQNLALAKKAFMQEFNGWDLPPRI